MDTTITSKSKQFFNRLMPMIKLDFYRLLHTPIFYIMVLIAALIPALVMTMMGGSELADAQTYTNVWQVFEGISGETAGLMDFANMANVNMVYIFAAILLSIFVSHDYSSGFVKNIFTVHAKKSDYIVSKSISGVFGGVCMILSYFLVTVIVGAITGKSFDLGAAGIGGLFMCLFSKIALMGLFVPLYLTMAVLFKQKLWMTIITSFAVGILFYPVASMAVPLNSSFITLIMCIVASAIAFIGIGAVSSLILNKRDLS